MDDLQFKNIPAEGFDPERGFVDRVSNPTPSRKGTPTPQTLPVGSSDQNRLSNPQTRSTADRNRGYSGQYPGQNFPLPPVPQQPYGAQNQQQYSAPVQQNPYGTQNPYGAQNPYGSPMPQGDLSARPSVPSPTRREPAYQPSSGDAVSRASTPTPTRRDGRETTERFDTGSVLPYGSRTSNSVQRRRTSGGYAFPSQNLKPVVTPNPMQTGSEESRASNPTPTRRSAVFYDEYSGAPQYEQPQQYEQQPQEPKPRNSSDDLTRLSNYIPPSRKSN